MKNLPVVFFIPSIGMKILILVLFNNILVFSNKILVFFDRSIRIPRAHARNHKVFYPCNRCHLATLLENQRVTCGNEVTRVTRNGVFALIFTQYWGTEARSFYYFSVSPYLCVYQNTACGLRRYPNSVFHPMEQTGRCRLRGSKVPPPRVEGAASEGRRCRLQGSKVRASSSK